MPDLSTIFLVYRRQRSDARRASILAGQHMDAACKEVSAKERWEFGGQFVDYEIAAPFCSRDELRPGWHKLLAMAMRERSAGREVRIIVDAGPLGPGDPFLPPRNLAKDPRYPPIYVTNFHLRRHALLTPLSAAWRYFDNWCSKVRASQVETASPSQHTRPPGEVLVRCNPQLAFANIFYTNASEFTITLSWNMFCLNREGRLTETKHKVNIAPGEAALLETVCQGDQREARHFQIRRTEQGITWHGLLLLSPEQLASNNLQIAWVESDAEPLRNEDFGWQNLPHPVTRRLALRRPVFIPGDRDDINALAAIMSMDDINKIDRTARWHSPYQFLMHQARKSLHGPALWVVERRSDHRAIGLCGVLPADIPALDGSYELFCWIEPSARLAGYAQEAANCVLRCAFEGFAFPHDTSTRTIVAWVDQNDRSATRFINQLGMKQVNLASDHHQSSTSTKLFSINSHQFWLHEARWNGE